MAACSTYTRFVKLRSTTLLPVSASGSGNHVSRMAECGGPQMPRSLTSLRVYTLACGGPPLYPVDVMASIYENPSSSMGRSRSRSSTCCFSATVSRPGGSW
jgi:hypothetical protein